MLRVALTGLFARKVRLLMTVLCIVIGVAAISGTYILTDSLDSSFRTLFHTTASGVDVDVRNTKASHWFAGNNGHRPGATGTAARVPASVLDAVRDVPGVEQADGVVAGQASVLDSHGNVAGDGPPPLAFSWAKVNGVLPVAIDGRPPTRHGEIVIDRGTASALHAKVGSSVHVLLNHGRQQGTFRVSGIAHIDSSSDLGALGNHIRFSIFQLGDARRVFNSGNTFDLIGVLAQEGTPPSVLRDRIQRVLPAGIEAVTSSQRAAEQLQAVGTGLSFIRDALLGFAAVSLFVGAFIIYITFSVIVAQRSRELGLLRAIGATRRQVVASVVVEGLALGLVSAALGLLAGWGLANGVVAVLGAAGVDLPTGSLAVHPRTFVVAFLVGIGVTLVSSLVPAARASRVSPLAAMRDLTGLAPGMRWWSSLVALLLLAGGVLLLYQGVHAGRELSRVLLMLGTGFVALIIGTAMLTPLVVRPVIAVVGAPLRLATRVTGKLASANATRSPRRTASTAAAVMIGLGLVSFAAIFTSSVSATIGNQIDRTVGADLYVANKDEDAVLPPQVGARLRALPELQHVVGVRYGEGELGLHNGHAITGAGAAAPAPKVHAGRGSPLQPEHVQAMGVDPARLGHTLRLDMREGTYRNLGPNDVIVADDTAARLGVHVGDVVPMRFGQRTRHLTVRGLYRTGAISQWIMSDAAWRITFPAEDQVDWVYYLDAAPGVSTATARRAVQRALGDEPFVKVQDQSQLKSSLRDRASRLFALLSALLAMTLVIAFVGIVNTLALSVFERTREIGLLRAVGTTRWQVRWLVAAESVMISLVGAVLGLALGLGLGLATVAALRDRGLELAVPLPFVVVLTAATIVVGVLASLLPAWRAGRLDVLRAIAAE